MQIIIVDNKVSINATGLELLKLKAKLSPFLGANLSATKENITFPKECLPLLDGILGDESMSSQVTVEISKYSQHAVARESALSVLEERTNQSSLGTWKEVLEPAQAAAVSSMETEGLLGLCLFDEQGSGKTVMTIAAFDVMRKADQIDAMIVVCPKSMVSEWPKDLERFLGRELKTVIALGNQNDRFNTALSGFDVLVSNYEGISPMLVPLDGISKNKRFLLVIDESYYAKNEDSQRSAILSRLRQSCVKCFVLCGTPAPNSAHDLINQFNLADLGYTFGGFNKSKDPASDWDRISSLIETRGTFIRRLKTEILDFVPQKDFHVITMKMVGKQQLMYETARHDLELELRSLSNEVFKKKFASYFQKRAALLQICCCPSALDPTAVDVPIKYTVLDELLEKLTTQKRKVIIWSYYRKSIDELVSRYSKYNPVRVDGSVSTEIRKQAVISFQTDPDTLLFIGNPAAAGAGITLHSAYDAVYISYSNQAAHYLQSLDRIHRRGQISEHVNYYLLVCEGTIEETEVRRLRGKEIRQHDLLGDAVQWPTSLDDALNELNGHV